MALEAAALLKNQRDTAKKSVTLGRPAFHLSDVRQLWRCRPTLASARSWVTTTRRPASVLPGSDPWCPYSRCRSCSTGSTICSCFLLYSQENPIVILGLYVFFVILLRYMYTRTRGIVAELQAQ